MRHMGSQLIGGHQQHIGTQLEHSAVSQAPKKGVHFLVYPTRAMRKQ